METPSSPIICKDLLLALEWKRLQEATTHYFQLTGLFAEESGLGPDGGIDIRIKHYANAPSSAIGVQCKARPKYEVPVSDIRSFFGALQSEKIPEGYFIATSSFSGPAIDFAEKNKIHTLDADGFILLLRQLSPSDQQRWLQKTTKGDYRTPTCPECGRKLGAVTKGSKPFWGCSKYPECRGALPMRKDELARYSDTIKPEEQLTPTAPPHKPSIRTRQASQQIAPDIVHNSPRRIGRAWFWSFAFAIIAALVFLRSNSSRIETQSPVAQPQPTTIAKTEEAIRTPLEGSLKPVVDVVTAPPPAPVAHKPLFRYKTPLRPFLLTVESRQPANNDQILLAAESAKKAVSVFAPEARPPFFAVATLPNKSQPRLAAYMVFDTQTQTFCSNDVFLTGTRQPARTIAMVYGNECFFVNSEWLENLSSD